ncbi:MAG TPA: DUF4142 domain-containing protein [Blastocatellia bacterium]|nr:DUF4142 domain-containing protein [Blastocatellia bacterium]
MIRHLFIVIMLAALCVPTALAQQPPSATDPPQTGKAADKAKQDQHHDKNMKHDDSAKSDTTKSATLSGADKTFVMKAATGGMAEVSLGQVAAGKATNDEVKQFGQRMVDDHGKANQELTALASQKGITLPADTDAKHKATQDRLSKLSGADFDRQYVREMLKDHEKDVAMFEKEARTAHDPDLKAWVEKTLPTLRDHLKMVRDLSGKINTSASNSGKAGKKDAKSYNRTTP